MISAAVPDLNGLELLDAIAASGSMSAAATALGITQQAASLRIRSMEHHLGVALLVRSTRGSALTPAGALLHEWSAGPPGLHARTVAHDELLLVVRPDHPWARDGRAITGQQLAATPLVGREPGSGSRQAFDEALAAALPEGPDRVGPALEVSTAAAVRAAVAAGAGPAAVSSLALGDDLALGRVSVVPVTGLDLRRTLRAIWRGDPRPPAGPVRDLLAIAAHPRGEQGR